MKSGKIIKEDSEIKDILENAKTIAILGLSPKPDRDSNRVARYLKDHGYSIIPVRPGQEEILGQSAYATLDDIKENVDIVDVFRNPEQILPHAHEAIRMQPKISSQGFLDAAWYRKSGSCIAFSKSRHRCRHEQMHKD